MKEPIGSKFKIAASSQIVPCQLASQAILTEKPYPIKAGLIFGTNPMITHANSIETYKAFKKLDFLVVADLFMNPTTEMADIVLPVAANLEYNDLSTRPGYIALRPKVVEPPGDCLSDLQWINLIAKEMGFETLFWQEEITAINHILEPTRKSFNKLKEDRIIWAEKHFRKYLNQGFDTTSGKVELFSHQLYDMGLSPLPVYKEPFGTPFGSPELSVDYPLVITSGKNPFYYHSSHRNVPSLRKLSPEPITEMHPHTAKRFGLTESEPVIIETLYGCIRQKLKYNSDLDPRIIYSAFGWWFPEKKSDAFYGWTESNFNVLTSNTEYLDPALGGPNLRGLICRVKPVQ